jgi:hypothetical protein
MADGMATSQNFSADLLAVVGDAKGAAKAIKAEMRDAEKAVKAQERELKKLEKQRAKLLKTGGSVSALDKQIKEQRDLLSGSVKRVSSVENKKREADRIKEISDNVAKRADKSIVKKMGVMQQQVSRNVIGTFSRIRGGQIGAGDFQALGDKATALGMALHGKGYKRLGSLISKSGASLSKGAMGAAGAAAGASAIALAGWKLGADIIADDKAAAATQRKVEGAKLDLVRTQAFSSGMSTKRMMQIQSSMKKSGDEAREAFKTGNLYSNVIAGIGDIVGADFRGAEKKYGAEAQLKEYQVQKLVDKFGRGSALSLDGARSSAFVQEELRKETSKYGFWSRIAQGAQDFFTVGETTDIKLNRLSQDYRLKMLQDKEGVREDTITRLMEDPMWKNIQTQNNNHLRAVEEQMYISKGNAHHM